MEFEKVLREIVNESSHLKQERSDAQSKVADLVAATNEQAIICAERDRLRAVHQDSKEDIEALGANENLLNLDRNSQARGIRRLELWSRKHYAQLSKENN